MEHGARVPIGTYSIGVSSDQNVPGSVPIAATPTHVHVQPPVSTPVMQHAIALQQYHFQQSLLNQQILAQQQAATNAVNIKAAAEEAAARAAHISKILSGENALQGKEKPQQFSPNRERAEPLPRLRSRSMSRSSKSKSVSPSRSPLRYKYGRTEHGRCSSRGDAYHRSNRYSRYSNRGYDRNYYRSSYRRDFDHCYHDRGYQSRHRNRNRSRSRSRSLSSQSPSKSRTRNYHERSLSPEGRPNRSSSESGTSSKEGIRNFSRSPVRHSLSLHAEKSKSRSEEKCIDEESLNPSKSSESLGVNHAAKSANIDDDDDGTSVGKNEKPKPIDGASSSAKRSTRNGPASYSPRSVDRSAGQLTRELQRNSVLLSHPSDSENFASPPSSNEVFTSRSPGGTEEESILPSFHGRVHHKTSFNHKDDNTNDSHGDLGALDRNRTPELKVRGYPGHDKTKSAFQVDNVLLERGNNAKELKHDVSHFNAEPDYKQKTESVIDYSAYDEGLVARSQIYHISEEGSENLVTSTEKTLSNHRGGDGYPVAKQGGMDFSPETGVDMNKNLMPYLTAEAGDESDTFEKVDDDAWGKISVKVKSNSKRSSKSREEKSKHRKKERRKHRREELKKTSLKHHKKHRAESEGEVESHKRYRTKNSGDKCHKRHRTDDSEESKEKHHKRHKRDYSEEGFVRRDGGQMREKNKHHKSHKHGHREKKKRKHQTTSSSSSSSEHSPSSL